MQELSIAILNCYPRKSRDNFDAQNVGHPHNLYTAALRRHVPRVAIDVIFVADPDTALPDGAGLNSYDGFIWTGSDLTIYQEDLKKVGNEIDKKPGQNYGEVKFDIVNDKYLCRIGTPEEFGVIFSGSKPE